MTEPAFDLRRARLNAGLSIRGLAREAGVHEQIIRRLEAGEGARPQSVKPVADFFGVKVLDIAPGLMDEAA